MSDTVMEVENISKLQSRSSASTRQRLAKSFGRVLLGLPPEFTQHLRPGEFWSLNDVSFSLKRGDALGVIGLNGAGKTTLLRILAGQYLPDAGQVSMLGNVAAMIDLTAGFQMNASGRRNIILRGAMLGRSPEEMAACKNEIIAFAELGDAIEASVSTYSSGMLMRLAFSIMVSMQPDILLVDEILAVGDFQFRQKCLSRIRELRKNAAIILVSHSMADIQLFCDSVMVLRKGEVLFHGAPEEAVNIYQEMREPKTENLSERQAKILAPQFKSDFIDASISHYWCDKAGNKIDSICSGETLYFRAEFKCDHVPRNLVLGIPVWNESGDYITGFSTELQDEPLEISAGEHKTFQLEIPDIAFNPGIYVSNLGITDGLEFLYRSQNPTLTVLPLRNRYWGAVTLPHKWISTATKEGQ